MASHSEQSSSRHEAEPPEEHLRALRALQQKVDALELEVAAHRRIEQQHSDFLNNSLECLHKVGPDGSILWANKAELDLLGYQHDEYVGHHIREFHVDQDVIQEILDQLTSGEDIYNRQARLRCKDGSIRDVLIHSNAYFENDELVYTRCFTRDISESKLADRDRGLLAAIVETSEDAIVSKNLNTIITSWNAGAERLFGYTAEEAIGQSINMLIPEDRRDEEPEILSRIRRGERISHFETIRRRKDGSLVNISLAISPIIDCNGNIVGASKIARDISQQVETKKQLEQAINRAERANEAKTSFLANISHELRTPMTAVLGFADILRIELDDPEQLERVDTITRNGKYLLTLLDDLLDLSKIEAGKTEIARESMAVRSLIKDVSALMSVRAFQEGIPLKFEWLTEVPKRVTADRIRTRQILVNLISNALKFTNEGEVKVQMRLNRENEVPTLDFSVIDTGIGIAPDKLQEIFQPFTQASYDTGREFGGAGLGLSISRRLAQAMGGTISVQSEPGKGSCFTLSLKVNDKQLKDLVQPLKTPIAKRPTGGSGGKLPRIDARVLLADDRRDVWRVGKYFLERCGAEVAIAEDGRQALDCTLAAVEDGKPFQVILMDMQMPVMNGEEAVRELRAKGIDVPIIALTADAMQRQREACLKVGCTDYFAKPIDGIKLMQLVASHLQP